MAYATAVEMRSEINKLSNADDTVLTAILSAAERTINLFCNRPDGFIALSVATARIYAGQGKPYIAIDECVSISLVSVKTSATDSTYTTWAAGDWIAFSGDPKDPNFNGLPYTALMTNPTGSYSLFTSGKYMSIPGFRPETDTRRGVPTVQVTAKWGYSVVVPADIKQACIMQAARWYKQLESAKADVMASGDFGTLLYRQAVDPDIKMILVNGRYVKPALGRR